MTVEVRRAAEGLQLQLSGEWGMREFSAHEAQLAAIELAGIRQALIATAAITRLDLSGAWALRRFMSRAREAGVKVSFAGAAPDQLRLLDTTLKDEVALAPLPPASSTAIEVEVRALTFIGRHTVGAWHDMLNGLAFLGRIAATAGARPALSCDVCARSRSRGTSTTPASRPFRSSR